MDGLFECLSVELAAVKIPAGIYPVTLTESNHLQRLLPLLGNVPGRTGIRIHSINKVRELEGCVGVGNTRTSDAQGFEYPSRPSELALVSKVQAALARGEEVTIEVSDEIQPKSLDPLLGTASPLPAPPQDNAPSLWSVILGTLIAGMRLK